MERIPRATAVALACARAATSTAALAARSTTPSTPAKATPAAKATKAKVVVKRASARDTSGPVVSVTRFDHYDDALKIANDTLYGLGAGVWTRDMNTAYRMGRGIQAGRVWTNCYHAYPAHAAFGGYKGSGVGRETHHMMLDHYQQTKNLLVSYNPQKLGFF